MPKQRFQDPPVKQNKNGSYYIRPWVDVILPDGKPGRKQKVIPLGPVTIGARKAQAKKAEVMAVLNRSDFVAQSQIKFSDLLNEYESDHVEHLGYSTRNKYSSLIRKHIRPAFQDHRLCDITPKEVRRWLEAKDLSPNSKTDIRNVMSGVFTYAKREGYWKEENPIQNVSTKTDRVRTPVKLTIEQTRALINEMDPMPRIVTMIGLFTTMRISEILGLQEKHLDFERKSISIEQRYYRGDLDKTKTRKSTRTVTMGGLEEYFKGLCVGDPEHFIILSHQSCRSDQNLRNYHLARAAKKLGFHREGFGFHSLRREAITEIGAIVGPQVIMQMAGHTKMDLTMLYTLTDTEKQRVGAEAYMKRVMVQ